MNIPPGNPHHSASFHGYQNYQQHNYYPPGAQHQEPWGRPESQCPQGTPPYSQHTASQQQFPHPGQHPISHSVSHGHAYRPQPAPHYNCNMDHSHAHHSAGRPSPLDRFPTGKLNVTVIKARDIKGDEWLNMGKADPYAILELGGRDVDIIQAKTTVHQDAGSEPVWNQVFTFFIKKQHLDYNNLSISLFDKNRACPDTPLGKLSIVNMGPFVTGSDNHLPEQWYPIHLKGQRRGEISLVLDFQRVSEGELLNSTNFYAKSVPEITASGHKLGGSKVHANWFNVGQLGMGVAQVGLASAALAV